MVKNTFWTGMLIAIVLTVPVVAFSQEDRVVQVAIDTFRANIRLPPGDRNQIFREEGESDP